jgi:hypothetical protein
MIYSDKCLVGKKGGFVENNLKKFMIEIKGLHSTYEYGAEPERHRDKEDLAYVEGKLDAMNEVIELINKYLGGLNAK